MVGWKGAGVAPPVMSFAISSSVYPTASFAATFAIGNPVALEASAEDRDTRGFISITTIRPVCGGTANWMLQPPVSTPTSRSTAMARSRMRWYSRSVSVIAGAAHGERRPQHHRQAEGVRGGDHLVQRVADRRAGHVAADPADHVLELLP